MRSLYFVIVVLFLGIQSSVAQEKQIEKIISFTKKGSIYTDNVDWDSLTPKVKEAVDLNANTTYDQLAPAVGVLLDALDDSHSQLTHHDKRSGRAHPTDKFERLNDSTKSILRSGATLHITKLENIGYIRIPGSHNEDDAQIFMEALCGLDINSLSGLIIDLRINTGGNMWTMIAGLAPILENGILGYFEQDSYLSEWKLKKNKIYSGKNKMIRFKKLCSLEEPLKIAVLLGPITASSGEMTAIALKGKEYVKFFGERTAGYVTVNNQYNIEGELYYQLSSGYCLDRDKNEYRNYVEPDIEIIGGDAFNYLQKDQKVIKAMEWLR
ncbi:S41 family peptidase [Zunongwangia endophytica]|uniref:S41 family peptidase n=1 Tax=Zunongwangia endophytica TaxID=1808945 RepID=A0ABV8HCT1_9FLAO|nr:S41 family peptidase [Zunongwangia endophytica]MDN3594055.1 S41 family peptidase [Zunongwangia endophytica]